MYKNGIYQFSIIFVLKICKCISTLETKHNSTTLHKNQSYIASSPYFVHGNSRKGFGQYHISCLCPVSSVQCNIRNPFENSTVG